MPETNENYPRQDQVFDVVLIKDGKFEHNAEESDFKRVTVSADGTLAALQSPALEPHKKGYRTLFATTPGVLSEPEIMARRHRLDPPVDKSKI